MLRLAVVGCLSMHNRVVTCRRLILEIPRLMNGIVCLPSILLWICRQDGDGQMPQTIITVLL